METSASPITWHRTSRRLSASKYEATYAMLAPDPKPRVGPLLAKRLIAMTFFLGFGWLGRRDVGICGWELLGSRYRER